MRRSIPDGELRLAGLSAPAAEDEEVRGQCTLRSPRKQKLGESSLAVFTGHGKAEMPARALQSSPSARRVRAPWLRSRSFARRTGACASSASGPPQLPAAQSLENMVHWTLVHGMDSRNQGSAKLHVTHLVVQAQKRRQGKSEDASAKDTGEPGAGSRITPSSRASRRRTACSGRSSRPSRSSTTNRRNPRHSDERRETMDY